MIYWITGRSGAGKTVYAKRLKREFEAAGCKVLMLDADDVRTRMNNKCYDDESRRKHIMDVAAFAAIAESQGFIVVVSIISPKKEWRNAARKLFDKSMLIYLPGGMLWPGTTYEEPDHEEFMCEG